MEEKNTTINGLKVNYKIAEEAEPLFNLGGVKLMPDPVPQKGVVLILHGWGGSSDSWTEIIKSLAEQGYKVVAIDFPGFGKSLTPPKPWTINDYTNLVFDFTEKLEIKDFTILGHSFGGRVAVRFIVRHPEKVKNLILVDAAGIKAKLDFKTTLIFLASKTGNALFSSKYTERFKDSAKSFFYKFLRHKDYVKADGTMKETMKLVLREDMLPDLSKINTKTFIIWGKEDKLVPVKFAYIFKKNITDSEVKVLPEVGHSPHLEAPEKLSEIILNFLNKF
jgi:pimeloyl-ACP methyl ester carboxylesterase